MAARTFENVFVNHPSVAGGVGWDKPRYLQLGRASWRFQRDRLDFHVIYRNLWQELDYSLGTVPVELNESQLLELFAAHHESHTPADWVIIGKRIFAMTVDRGLA